MNIRSDHNQTEYILVNSKDTLMLCLQQTAQATEVSLDIEFDRDRYSYGTTLCLIQLSDGNNCYVIDPFSFTADALRPLFAFLENEKIVKIMHAPGEDLHLLGLQGCFPKSIFDTERCARLLNFQSFSLSALVFDLCGAVLDKSQQKTDWNKRPLSNSQLIYAAQDVVYLSEIKHKLEVMAREKGILHWLAEENSSWNSYKMEEKQPGQFASKDDSKRIPPFQLFIYNALLGIRDRHAQRSNKPGYQVIAKEILIDLSFKPELISGWFDLKGIHPKFQTEEVKLELTRALEESRILATEMKLPKHTESSRYTPQQRAEQADERRRIADKVDVQFRPILEVITQRYGEFAASYLLNEKTMTELVSGKLRISTLPYAYRTELILGIGKDLEINVNAYL
jgi:ribonuclease D